MNEWFEFFEKVSCLYREMFMLPLWEKYPNYETDIWDSLAIFLEGYAFERRGRNPHYSPAAVDALLHCREMNNNDFIFEITNMIWEHFRQLLNYQGLNPIRNPLYPSGNPDNLEGLGDKLSIIEIVIQNNLVEQGLTLISYLKNRIKKEKNVEESFNLLKRIRGIGDKIASFFLRDLVDMTGIDLVNVENRALLQPIDVWVERTITYLNPELLVNVKNKNKNEKIAECIVSNSLKNDVKPERVNMGIWFFCSQIIKSKDILRKVLKNIDIAQKFVDIYIWLKKSM